MAIGKVQTRPVTAFTISAVNTLKGAIETLGAIGGTQNGTLTPGTYELSPTSDNSVLGAGADVTITVGAGPGFAISAALTAGEANKGSGYAAGEILTFASDGADWSDDDTDTITVTIATVNAVATAFGEVNTVTAAGGTGWKTGDVVSANELNDGTGSGVGLAGTVTATALVGDTPETGGVVTGFTVTAGGSGYTLSDTTIGYIGAGEAGPPTASYYDHSLYEQGGVVQEYTRYIVFAANQQDCLDNGFDWISGACYNFPSGYTPQGTIVPPQGLIKVVRTADKPQRKVAQWEPTIVSGDGTNTVLGNTLRAEDINDNDRCVAAGFAWEEATTNQGLGKYGYCRDNTSIVLDPALDKIVCEAGGFFFDPIGGVCIAALVDAAGVNAYNVSEGYDTNPLQSKAICEGSGFLWDGTTCIDPAADFSILDKAGCAAAMGIWIAGTCYDPADFGNGQGGNATEQEGSHNL